MLLSVISTLTAALLSVLPILDNPDVKAVVGDSAPIWKMTLAGPQGECPEYMPDFAQYRGCTLSADGGRAEFVWNINIERSWDWTVRVAVEMEDGLPQWSFSASLPLGWTVTQTQFPIVRVARPEGSKAIIPMGYGAEFGIPVGGRLESRYPSVTGGMEFVMTHSPQGCLYFAARDREGSGKYFYIDGTSDELVFTQMVPSSFGWTRDGEFTLPWTTTFAFSDRSWDETLLQWYRPFVLECEWASKPLTEKEIVPWVRDADVWIRPKNMFPEVLESLRKAVAYYDRGLGIHWYHWHHHEYDTMYPEYFPAKPGFKEMVAEVQAAGAHVTPYINGRLWDPANDWYESRNGARASCRKMDGSLYTELYPTSKVINTVTCPGSPIWQQIIKETTSALVNEYGTAGVYIDQVGAAASEPCYSTEHNHAPGGGSWWPAQYRKLLKTLRSDVFGPDRAITTEENAECYLDLFDMYLIVNTPHSAEVRMLPVFPLIYSDRVVYSGLNYYHPELWDGHFLYINGRSLLWGAQLGWIQPEYLFDAKCEVERKFLLDLGRFRAANHDIFYGGRFICELDLKGKIPNFTVFDSETYPVVMGAKWETVDGDTACILVNMGPKAIKVTLPDGRKARVDAYSAKRL